MHKTHKRKTKKPIRKIDHKQHKTRKNATHNKITHINTKQFKPSYKKITLIFELDNCLFSTKKKKI